MSCFTAGSSEKDTENGAPGNFFGPSYFEKALVNDGRISHTRNIIL